MLFMRLFLTTICMLFLSGAALAHTTVIASNIESGAEITAAPNMFEFSFGVEVGLAALELEKLSGEPVELNFVPSDKTSKDYSFPLPALEAGAYVIKWRAMANDGHVMRGEIDFSITN